MALKYTLDSIAELEEILQPFYKEDAGKYVLDVEGVKSSSDFDKVNNALSAERKNSKTYKDQYVAWDSKFTGKTPDEVFAQLERIPLLEAESTGKVDPKKHQELLEITAKQRMAPLEHEITKLKQATAERDQLIEQYKSADRKRTIHDSVRALAGKEGFQEGTYSSAEGALMLLAERYLTINEIGDVVVADNAKPYTSGLGLKEALGEFKTAHPYLLKQSVGGGATGSSGTPGGGPNPFRGNNLSERAKYIKANPDKWEVAMKSAGLTDPMAEYKPRN